MRSATTSDVRPEAGWATRLRAAIVAALAAFAVGGMIVHFQATIALLAPATVGVLVLAAMVRLLVPWSDDILGQRRILVWTMASFAVHLVVGLIVTSSDVLRYYLATDSYIYDALAQDIVLHWTGNLPLPNVPDGKEGFYYLLAGAYWVFGPHPWAGLALNAAFAAGLVPVVTDTTERLFGREAARRVAPLVVLFPSILLFTSQLLKEAVILLLIALAANGAVRISRRFSPGALAVVVVSLALLLTFRAWVAVVVAQGLVTGIAIGKERVVSGVSTALGTLALLALLVIPLGVGYSGYRAAITADLEQANTVRQDLALSASSGFAPEADISTSQRALSYLPLGLTNVSLGPFPWQVGGPRELPALVDVLVIWALLPSLVRGYRTARKRGGRRVLVLVLPALAALCLFALAVGNFGTIARERMQVLVLLIPLMAYGLAERKRRSEERGEVALATVSR